MTIEEVTDTLAIYKFKMVNNQAHWEWDIYDKHDQLVATISQLHDHQYQIVETIKPQWVTKQCIEHFANTPLTERVATRYVNLDIAQGELMALQNINIGSSNQLRLDNLQVHALRHVQRQINRQWNDQQNKQLAKNPWVQQQKDN